MAMTFASRQRPAGPALGRTATRAAFVATMAIVLGSVLPTSAPPAAATDSDRPPLSFSGSFIQPWLTDAWKPAKWTTELGYLHAAGMSDLVLNWTADSKAETTVYPTNLPGYTQSSARDSVGGALTAADGKNMNVYVGLADNDDWWTKHANNATWLNREAQTAIAVAEELWADYGSHASFSGWYLPLEVDNWNFATPTSWANLSAYYSTIANALHQLAPGLPVVISPFMNPSGGQTPAQWTQMWASVLSSAPIDVIALQDGAGDGTVSTAQIPVWFAATLAGIQAGRPSTQLWDDAETFNADSGTKDLSCIVSDLTAAQPYVTRFWSFSYDHYQSPLQVDPSYDATYRDYLATGTVESEAPSTPAGITATATGARAFSLTWTASTDNLGVVGYRIYRDGALVQSLYGTSTTVKDTGLTASTPYVYTVRAFDAAGNLSTPATVSVSTA